MRQGKKKGKGKKKKKKKRTKNNLPTLGSLATRKRKEEKGRKKKKKCFFSSFFFIPFSFSFSCDFLPYLQMDEWQNFSVKEKKAE